MPRLAVVLLLLSASAYAEPLVDGHTARILSNGRNSFMEKTASILDADVVMLKTYAFLDDETGRSMVKNLVKAAKAGKQVIVEFDVKGSGHDPALLAGLALGIGSSIPLHLQPLVDAGVTVIPTNRPRLGSMFLGRDHDKLLVTWKNGEPAKAIMGGMNVGNSYAWSGTWQARKRTKAFRDTDIAFTGPETAKVIDRFLEAAERTKPEKAAMAKLAAAARTIAEAPHAFEHGAGGEAKVSFVSNDPKHGKNPRAIEHLYERLIDETPIGETITIANAYTNFTKPVQEKLIAAMKRGAKVHLVVNSPDAKESEASNLAVALHDQLRSMYKRVPQRALEVTEFSGDVRRNEGSMHQKIAKFGANGPVVVGSHNHDGLSANFNSEAVVVVQSHRTGQQFDALINRMKREGKTRTLDQTALRKDSTWMKAKSIVLNRVVGHVL